MSRRAIAGAGLALVVVAAAVAVLQPFGGGAANSQGFDNATPTSSARVERRSLSSQTQVSATLGYADSATIALPSGTSPATLLQAQQAVDTAVSTLDGARATLAADLRALVQAQATRAADRQKQAVDCAGDNAASSSATSPCAADAQVAATDDQNVSTNAAKVDTDRRAVASAETALAAARTSLSSAGVSATAYGQTSTYTSLPAVGAVVERGGTLYAIDGSPVTLLCGGVTAWRPFAPGMSRGRDVAALNRNLRYLGYGAPLGDAFTGATESAIRAYQSARGLEPSGTLLLGAVVFQPGAVRVTSVTPTTGATVQAGPVLGVTSTRREVTIALDAGQQSEIAVGDAVEITLPDNSTTPGRVSYVGSVATVPSGSDNSGGDQTPTIEVDVTPLRPAATGKLDQAPVNVSITTATVRDALVVPVNALLALASGGYAVEVTGADGTRHLVAVQLGLFDDEEGIVQVTGSGLTPGMHVVVPAE